MRAGVWDLHVTIDPDTFKSSFVAHPWQVHDIHNVQGMPHLIVSQKYTGNSPYPELKRMAGELACRGVGIWRMKTELHFRDPADVRHIREAVGIIEVHFKYRQRGAFPVSPMQVEELNHAKFALSFNRTTQRPIVSVRFADLATYERKGFHKESLPDHIEDEEREIVVVDTNPNLDSFWPLRTLAEEKLKFSAFPLWVLRS